MRRREETDNEAELRMRQRLGETPGPEAAHQEPRVAPLPPPQETTEEGRAGGAGSRR